MYNEIVRYWTDSSIKAKDDKNVTKIIANIDTYF